MIPEIIVIMLKRTAFGGLSSIGSSSLSFCLRSLIGLAGGIGICTIGCAGDALCRIVYCRLPRRPLSKTQQNITQKEKNPQYKRSTPCFLCVFF